MDRYGDLLGPEYVEKFVNDKDYSFGFYKFENAMSICLFQYFTCMWNLNRKQTTFKKNN